MAWQLAAALIATQVASTAISYMGSQQQSRQLKASAAWDRYQLDLQKKQELIAANQDAADLLSYQRAAAGAGGGAITSGAGGDAGTGGGGTGGGSTTATCGTTNTGLIVTGKHHN